MCVICCSPKGAPQPDEAMITRMFTTNPHGAGYMVARGDSVHMHKGFMTLDELLDQLRYERFTKDDVVVYHFRISTQAGVKATMTQPFPLSQQLGMMKKLDLTCACGVAHNGIIPMTSTRDDMYSDTALFVAKFMPAIVRSPDDLDDPRILRILEELTHSKLAILDKSGKIATVGHFTGDDQGRWFSNMIWSPRYQNSLLLRQEV